MGETTKVTYTAFTVFAFLFALAQLFDNSNIVATFFDISSKTQSTNTIISALLCLSAVWVMLRPSSLYRSIILYVLVLLKTIGALPITPNHVVFQAVVLISILTCFVYLKVKDKSKFSKATFYETFAPLVRIEIVLLYFWATVHKINTGFFNQDISCTTLQLFNIKDVLPVLPTPQWLIATNPYFTLLTESMIPVLLIIPRTRVIGILVALIFHFILGFRYTGFTILVYAFLCLFIPIVSFDRIKPNFNRIVSKLSIIVTKISDFYDWRKNRYTEYVVQAIFLLLIFFFMGFFMRGNPNKYDLLSKKGLYILVCLVLFTSFFYFIVLKIKEIGLNSKIKFIPNNKWLIVFPIIIFINGLLPHLGVKNVQVMAMFSNLRISEGNTNHLLIPSSFQIFNNLSDTVTIKGANIRSLNQFSGYSSNRPLKSTQVMLPHTYRKYMKQNKKEYRKRFEYKIPYILLQNIITSLVKQGHQNIKLEYERGGEIIYTRNAELEPQLSNASIFQIKLLDQRAVPNDERGLCMW
jgi:hypothetical protein